MEPVPVAWVSLMRPPAPVSAPAAVQAIPCKAAAVQAIQCKAAAVQAMFFQMNCLRRICGTSLHNHVPNVDMLNRCNTLSVEFQLQGKRLRWLGHVFRMPNDRLPKKLLFGQVKGLRPPGRPRSSFNDVALHDCQTRQIGRPYKVGKTRLVPHIPSS